MKFGLTLPSYTWPGLDYQMTRRITKDMARRAEELGFDSITVWDHLLSAPGLYGGSWLDPLMVLSCAAGVTERIPLGTHILVVPIRHPVLLAKELGTLDYLSGGLSGGRNDVSVRRHLTPASGRGYSGRARDCGQLARGDHHADHMRRDVRLKRRRIRPARDRPRGSHLR